MDQNLPSAGQWAPGERSYTWLPAGGGGTKPLPTYYDSPFVSVQTTPGGTPKQVPNHEWGKRNGWVWNGTEWVRIAQSEEEKEVERQVAAAARAQLDFDLTVRKREADRLRATPFPAKPSSPFGRTPANPEDSIRSLIAASRAAPQGGM